MTNTFSNQAIEVSSKISLLVGSPPDKVTHSKLITWSNTENDHFITYIVDQGRIVYKVNDEPTFRLTVERLLVLIAIIQLHKLEYVEDNSTGELTQLEMIVEYCISEANDQEIEEIDYE